MARVTLTQSAQTDLLEAWLFIAEENPLTACWMPLSARPIRFYFNH